jgi:predicted amidohydrolase
LTGSELTPVDALVPYIERAAGEGADLIVFPEYVLGNFRMGGPLVERLCGLALEHDLNVIVGGWEFLPGHAYAHPPVPGTYANTILVIGRNGTVAGTHRKMHPALGAESPFFWPARKDELGEATMVLGDGPTVIDLDFGRIGVLTCYDGYFFESFTIPSLQGAEVLVWPNGRGGSIEDFVVRTAAYLTCTHVVATNQSVGCGTMVCSYPAGILAVASEPGDDYISADLDLAFLRQQRRNQRMLHQRRPEIYGALVERWRPWEAYPDTPAFLYPGEDPATSAAALEEARIRADLPGLAEVPPAPAPAADGCLRVALLQMPGSGPDQRANLATALAYCRVAAHAGADIALFPEMFSIAYSPFHGTDPEAIRAWQGQAVTDDSVYVQQLTALAAELDMAIAFTCLQAWDSAPRNTLILVDRHGERILTYAKVHTCDFSNFEAACTPGTGFGVSTLDTRHGPVRVGAMICYDREFPESARALMVKGAEIILTPNACFLDDLRINQFQARAFENAVAVFMTNYPGQGCDGQSVAFGPEGAPLVRAGAAPGIFYADLDLQHLRGFRQKTIHGDAFRRPHRYGDLETSTSLPEFERRTGLGGAFERDSR